MTHTPHGLGVALLMPYVMRFNRDACRPELAQVAVALGVAGSETDEARLADLAITEVVDLFRVIGIPPTLKDLGFPATRQRWAAEAAMAAQRLVKNNPRPLDLDGMESIVRAAFAGGRAAAVAAS